MSDVSLQCQPVCCGQRVPPGFPGCVGSGGATGTSSESVTCPAQSVLCGTVLVAFGALGVQWHQCPGVMCTCGISGAGDRSILGCVCSVFLGLVTVLSWAVPVTAVLWALCMGGVPGTCDSSVLGCVCSVFWVLVAMVKLLSPGWSGDGSIPLCYLNPCPLQALYLERVSCRSVGTQDIRYGVILPYPPPCKVTSSSRHTKQLSQGSRGRGCRFFGWKAVSWRGWRTCEPRSSAGRLSVASWWGGGAKERAGLAHAAALQLGAGS